MTTKIANRRKIRRHSVARAQSATIEFHYPHPNGEKLVLPLIDISGKSQNTSSGIESETTGSGDGGLIQITSPNIKLSNEARITASTSGTGAGGTVNINTNGGTLTISGRSTSITSETTGSGNAGNVVIAEVGRLTVRDGAEISASVSRTGTGKGGNVDIRASVSATGCLTFNSA